MVEFTIKLAEKSIHAKVNYESTKQFCIDYLTDESSEIEVEISQFDIEREREISKNQNISEGIQIVNFSDPYLEMTALYRKIVEQLLYHDIFLFHGSVVAVDGKAYIFTAKSGTGKTTHTRLWLKNIEGSYVLNGDKPLIMFKEGKAFVCGTPWKGKESYGVNEILPLDGICILERSVTNEIKHISFKDGLSNLLTQSYHPRDTEKIMMTMKLVNRLESVNIFKLGCNMSDEAAFVSYSMMTAKKKEVTFENLLESQGSFCWKNVGISMMPLIRQGKDIMAIEKRPDGRLKKYDAVLYKRPYVKGRGEYILHRILKVNPDGTYWIVGDNCNYGETVEEKNVIGVLTAVKRGDKTISVDDFGYKLYVHLWCDFYPIRFFILKLRNRAYRIKTQILECIHKLYLLMKGQ